MSRSNWVVLIIVAVLLIAFLALSRGGGRDGRAGDVPLRQASAVTRVA